MTNPPWPTPVLPEHWCQPGGMTVEECQRVDLCDCFRPREVPDDQVVPWAWVELWLGAGDP